MRHLVILIGIVLASCTATPLAPSSGSLLSASSLQIQEDGAVQKAIKSGFRTRSTGEGKVYCREQSHLGTHFIDTACYTPDQLLQLLAAQQEVQDMLRVPATCSGGFDCNGLGKASGGK